MCHDLHIAVSTGDAAVVRSALARAQDVNVYDSNGRTPLHWAVVAGSLEIVELLLASEWSWANVNQEQFQLIAVP